MGAPQIRGMSHQGRRAPLRSVQLGRCMSDARNYSASWLAERSGGSVPSATPGKIAAGIAGATGTGSAGVSAFAVFRMSSAHAVPDGMLAALVALTVATGLVSSLGLILEYRLKKLDIQTRSREAQSAAELRKAYVKIHRTVLEKAAGEPGSADSYREIILANALYLSVEQNGVQLADKTHEHLYGLAPAPRTRAAQPWPSPATELLSSRQSHALACHSSKAPGTLLGVSRRAGRGPAALRRDGRCPHYPAREPGPSPWGTGASVDDGIPPGPQQSVPPERCDPIDISFATFYQGEMPYLTRSLMKCGADEQEAADAEQRAFELLLYKWSTVSKPRAWLRTVAIRQLLPALIIKRRESSFEEDEENYARGTSPPSQTRSPTPAPLAPTSPSLTRTPWPASASSPAALPAALPAPTASAVSPAPAPSPAASPAASSRPALTTTPSPTPSATPSP